MIRYEMNKFIHVIHNYQVIIYKKCSSYYVIDNDVYIFRSVFNFKSCCKNNRKIIFIDSKYINYILRKLRESNVSYVVINENYGYDKIVEYNSLNNKYLSYYKKGKRLIKNESKINFLINNLRVKGDINLLDRIELILDGY